MKSLHKTFDILEYVILQNGRKVTPSNAAEAVGVNLATCTRIMGELVDRGYLVKVSRKEGYLPGPMTVSIGTRSHPYERLAKAAAEPVRQLSEELRCQVNLAVLHGERRVMLCYHLNPAATRPWDHFIFSDHWVTATGRLLIASLEDRDARKIVSSIGIRPYPKAGLDKIRADGFTVFPEGALSVMGHLIQAPGYPAAAFGFGVPKQNEKYAFERSAATAETIRRKLSMQNKAY
ncbi:MAG: hypothetical protein BWY31_01935 [Lentisphaerae bacterium ADurb.Bin242]|nr:MAG: hypothetical protein BWY31_01935 [Lentisphaerae bacterium ADurb.Bin242]